MIRLTLPVGGMDAATADTALALNAMEPTSHLWSLGSWCPAEERLTHVTCLANCMYVPGLIANLAGAALARVRWVTEQWCAYDMLVHYGEALEAKMNHLKQLNLERAWQGGVMGLN